jgi:hypothetical protein
LGLFSGIPREFVLSEPAANLWEGIRDDAIEYFARNRIAWWGGEGDEPTGHLLSSQVSCLNHLYAIRQRPDLANAVLRAIDAEVLEAEVVDDGYVEFEVIAEHSYLGESPFSRGKYCTSIDAFMIGRIFGGATRGRPRSRADAPMPSAARSAASFSASGSSSRRSAKPSAERARSGAASTCRSSRPSRCAPRGLRVCAPVRALTKIHECPLPRVSVDKDDESREEKNVVGHPKLLLCAQRQARENRWWREC